MAINITTNPVITILDGQGNPQVIEVTTNPIVYIKNQNGVPQEYILTDNPQLGTPTVTPTPPSPTAPTVSTVVVSNITTTTAQSGGQSINNGGSTVVVKGCCWSESPSPTTADSKTTDGTGNSNFTSQLTNLNPGTTYYLKAYATNIIGTGYGAERTFNTVAVPVAKMIANYHFDNTLTDSLSGHTLAFDPNGGSTDDTGYTYITGKVNQALQVADPSDLFLLDNSDNAFKEAFSGHSKYSMCGWYKLQDYAIDLGLEMFACVDITTFSRYMTINQNKFAYACDGSHTTTLTGTTLVNDTWYHVAVVHDGVISKVYVNAVLQDSITTTQTINANDAGLVMTYGAAGAHDEWKIYSGELSASEILAIYNAEK